MRILIDLKMYILYKYRNERIFANLNEIKKYLYSL